MWSVQKQIDADHAVDRMTSTTHHTIRTSGRSCASRVISCAWVYAAVRGHGDTVEVGTLQRDRDRSRSASNAYQVKEPYLSIHTRTSSETGASSRSDGDRVRPRTGPTMCISKVPTIAWHRRTSILPRPRRFFPICPSRWARNPRGAMLENATGPTHISTSSSNPTIFASRALRALKTLQLAHGTRALLVRLTPQARFPATLRD